MAPNAIDRQIVCWRPASPSLPIPVSTSPSCTWKACLRTRLLVIAPLQCPMDYFISNWTHGVLSVAMPVDGQQTIQVERLVSTRDSAGGEPSPSALPPAPALCRKE